MTAPTNADGPQRTPADAYRHAAHLAADLAGVTRNRQLTAGTGPVFVRVERVEHLAAVLEEEADRADLADRAEHRDGG